VTLLVGIALAVLLGVILGGILARLRARRRPALKAPHDVAGLLRSYRHGHFDQVIDAAPDVIANMGAVSGASWRARIELVWGHSYFELDRFEESIPHFRRGLDDSPGPHEAEARFRHCLGFALQTTGHQREARAIYEELLSDDDLDPQVREGVERNLADLDVAGGGSG
jgi:tetratricopeptide (TPR) repeat protein